MQTKEDSAFTTAQEKLENSTDIDAQLYIAIEFMKTALSEGEKACFHDFWRMKKICLDLFKKEMHPTKRSLYWEEYTKILSQAHSLQKILEEQTDFQVEQISLAITALENELNEKEKWKAIINIEPLKDSVLDRQFLKIRKELAVLGIAKEKLLSLRKEILRQDIRIGQKNKLLVKISQSGDLIFPNIKKLTKQLSLEFLQCIDQFVSDNFSLSGSKIISKELPFALKQQIKSFQDILKILPVSNDIYRKIRSILSQCWDLISCHEKQKREAFEKLREQENEKLTQLMEQLSQIEVDSQVHKKTEEFIKETKSLGLSKDAMHKLWKEVGRLRDEFDQIKRKDEEKHCEIENKKKEEDLEKVKISIEILKVLSQKAKRMKLENLERDFTSEIQEINTDLIPKKMQFTYNKFTLQIEDIILIKRVKSSQEDQKAPSEKAIMQHKEKLKQMIYAAKKEIPLCGLDIEFVMELKEIIAENKRALSALA